MSQQILIDPVTRIEGHSKITLTLNDAGQVTDAHFHVTQYRGFEKFVEGRPFHEMPSLMARICGICPVSHLLAAAKACDALLAVRIPVAASHLRQIMNLAQMIQSHALSFFYLSAPDLLLGMDAPVADRSLFGIANVDAELARGGVRLRQIGQMIVEILGGKRIHPAWAVPGGVSAPLTADRREQMLALLPDGIAIIQRTIAWFTTVIDRFAAEIAAFSNFPTMFMALTNKHDTLEFYEGRLRFTNADGTIAADRIDADEYADFIAEAVEPHTYLKSPYYKPLGYPNGIYRVGPLARLNMVQRPGTPLADAAFPFFKTLDPHSGFNNHFARLIEILYGLEKIGQLLNEPDILSERVRAVAEPNALRGVGISEAPRGTLIHDYEIDENGLMKRANLIIATGHNNLAMDRGVLQTAQAFVDGTRLTDGMLNRVEAVIRAYDPCLSCSTHAVGQMPLHVELRDPAGTLLDQVMR